ncbi:hypothetical protein DCO58_12505 [Helicobacter saguini]|uniref:Uncharacterized protein n=1 Tax=Helicobacter saguini TaxID=1548018 RepID=A0A347VQM5_9HELI|nr:hypothetical protein [Helicobacter saguini]MWV60890.1 hypothetical protein [Helicobacter saguini]MWV68442.1 hypothetical protein [Helicobacter saguini]MWV70094.1 hypothetical protein [Helicobacter saguini]MWV71997.1 hypothetical protein [Helicobacter saguini]TLD91653.1 hypothetical protein LS64_011525 [Helicobacter saguini]
MGMLDDLWDYLVTGRSESDGRVIKCPATNGQTSVKCGAVVTRLKRVETTSWGRLSKEEKNWTKDYRCPSCGKTIKVQCVDGTKIYTSVVR